MPGIHHKKTPGRHRKPSTRTITWRATGGVVVGAAVLGTAAATAQASVLPFGPPPAANAFSELTTAGKDAGVAASKDREKDGLKPKSGNAAKGGGGATKQGGAPAKPSGKSRPTAAEAIKLARSQVGIEEEDGGGTKFQKWYMGTSRARQTLARDGGSLRGYGDANWCDMFISWIGERIGFTDQIGSDAWTVAHARWFQANGRWGTEPRPGAIVFYAWDGGKASGDIRHVGMVIKKVDAGTIEAVEGNTGNAVRVKERSTSDIVGYGYPGYKA
ncbi:CHAP domain-containing protein [Actinomadura soli]|uniref:CHAP domain-containing protein n=1 Tax=Actinomadura soli TaxID=2508997 RepID=A0A5C4J6G9_9ACTN|nr:CHAP domain-containing protein [Actinomadura soli]TMQ93082.1 CHAP domain-containing protein [Actinomadura soli]